MVLETLNIINKRLKNGHNFYTFALTYFVVKIQLNFIVVSGKGPVHETFYIMILVENINSFMVKNSIFFKIHLWVTMHLWVTWV